MYLKSLSAVFVCLSFFCIPMSVVAQPSFSESGWSLSKTVDLADANSVAFNPFDGNIYVATRTGGVISRWESGGSLVTVADSSNVAAIAFDPNDGDLFVGLDFPGQVLRGDYNGGNYGTLQTWISGFGTGDDDTAGIAYVPDDHSGSLISPGTFLNVDRDNLSNDSIFSWSAMSAENEVEIYNDSLTQDIVAVLATDTSIYVADWAASATNDGGIFELVDDGVGGATLAGISTTGDSYIDPSAIALDPLTSDLIIRANNTAGAEALFRLDLSSATSTEIASGLDPVVWNSIAISDDGLNLYFSSGDQVFHYSRAVPEPGTSFILLTTAVCWLSKRRRERRCG